MEGQTRPFVEGSVEYTIYLKWNELHLLFIYNWNLNFYPSTPLTHHELCCGAADISAGYV